MSDVTHSFEVHRDSIHAIQEELASRVRLRFKVKAPRWWQVFRYAVVTITGPGDAIASAAKAIEALEYEVWSSRHW